MSSYPSNTVFSAVNQGAGEGQSFKFISILTDSLVTVCRRSEKHTRTQHTSAKQNNSGKKETYHCHSPDQAMYVNTKLKKNFDKNKELDGII